MKFFFSHRRQIQFLILLLCFLSGAVFIGSCNSFVTHFMVRSVEQLPATPDTVAAKIEHPVFSTVGLSVLWVGHATCLIQIDDKVFLTDPIFTSTAGMISKRRIEPGIHASSIDRLHFILISHLHFDHLNFSSLSMLPKNAILILPPGGKVYVPEFGFSDYHEMKLLSTFDADGVRITAVPVKHFNGRYGFENAWIDNPTYTGYVIEYHGKTIFFAGDTGYDSQIFKDIGKRFSIDVALIPIAPVEPRDFMRRVHADPEEALQIFKDVGAKFMVPIHHSTFEQGLDSSLVYARNHLKQLVTEQHMEDRVLILNMGEQKIIAQ